MMRMPMPGSWSTCDPTTTAAAGRIRSPASASSGRSSRRPSRSAAQTIAPPAQLVGDLLAGRVSTELGKVEPSYRPGVTLCDLREVLPDFITNIFKKAIPRIAREIPGFERPDAILTAVETRSSSPLRITRDHHTLQSENTPGLYPAGEGAGYAGGIISAAADGLRVAEAILGN